MIPEAASMAWLLTGSIVRGDVNGQYHWATLIQLDALARGAAGLEVEDASEEARR